MRTIRVAFGDFWPGFDPQNNYFTRALEINYKVELHQEPELFFFTHPYNGRRDYLNYKCHRVFLGWENERTDWSSCDYALDSDFISNNPRHKRWPIWAAWNLEKLIEPKDIGAFSTKTKFACMVVSNPHAKERIEFFHALSKYKKVDSGGKYLNNIGAAVIDKLDFIKDYKFVLAFENSSYPGYTTEKIFEPMLVNSIPIYWGNPVVGTDFNTNSFIHVNQFSSFDEAIQRIVELDQDDDKYMRVVLQPWFRDNKVPEEMSIRSFENFLAFIVEDMGNHKAVGSSLTKSNIHRFKLLSNKIRSQIHYHYNIGSRFR